MDISEYKIPFNKPYLTGKEAHYMYDAVYSGKLSGNGKYTKLCQSAMNDRYGFGRSLLTTSCTDALEMAAILIDIQPGDEIIMPSYTFVSTANAFILRGAKIVFADSRPDHPGIDEDSIESLITSKTKAIVPVHYAGVACDMNKIIQIAEKHELFIIEDAAQAIDSYYVENNGSRLSLGSLGTFGAFSFHETKNIIAGEGGLLAVNDSKFEARSEIIWEKGTNRSAFFRNEVDKYGWVDVGSSFLPSEIIAAFLYAQIEALSDIQYIRSGIWQNYFDRLQVWAKKNGIRLPFLPEYATNNYHMFYMICSSLEQRTILLEYLKSKGVLAVFHYLSLHDSPFYQDKHDGRQLVHADHFSNTLIRLPFYNGLSNGDQDYVIETILSAPI